MFMRLQVWQEKGIEAIDPEDGSNSYLMPASMAAHCLPVTAAEIDSGAWWAWYSAPGYMDRTEPVYGRSAVEAARECWDMFGDWESSEARSEYATVLWQCRKAGK